jgi:hypothetical protein
VGFPPQHSAFRPLSFVLYPRRVKIKTLLFDSRMRDLQGTQSLGSLKTAFTANVTRNPKYKVHEGEVALL